MKEPIPGEMLPISSLNALEYCPRSFYYQLVQGEWPESDDLLERYLTHPSDSDTIGEREITTTRLFLVSETLRLSGFAEVIEERSGVFIPVEYQGSQSTWLTQHFQLCAQALCLEERQPGKPSLPYGYLLSSGSQRRTRVVFTPQLRAATREAIARAWELAALDYPPPPLSGKMAARCPSCHLLLLCLPEEVHFLHTNKGR